MTAFGSESTFAAGSTFAALVIGDQLWLLPAAGILAAALLVLALAHRKLSGGTKVRLAALLLKTTGLAILAACLVEPLWSGMHARPGSNIFLLLADDSPSMQVRDAGASISRGDALKRTLADDAADKQNSWQVRLSQDFDVRRHIIDDRMRHVDNFAEMTFDGTATSLGAALATLQERFRGRPVGGILLLTDGNATDLDEADLNLDGLPPIYPVLIGNGADLKDIAIRNVSISQTSFEDAPISIQADVTAAGFDGAELLAQLCDEGGQVVEQQTQTVQTVDTPLAFRFQFKPKKLGVSFYRLKVIAKAELGEQTASSEIDLNGITAEATRANNVRTLKIDRGAGPYRVLYVSGRPNWEFKFLRRALKTDEQVDLVGLIRVANREPKFDWRGRDDESSNPLFRGFKKSSDEETERYDQPVLVRLNTKNPAELRDGFPKSEEDLFRFTAVILDDVESEFFTRDQMELLEAFVSKRGGGLLMLGGQESFHDGKYMHTPIGDMLPVYLDRPASGDPQTRYRLELTRTGWLRPWVRLRSNEADEFERLAQMPEFHTLNHVKSIKPGATVLSTVADGAGKKHAALIAQRFGRGRTAALTIGDLWRWQLNRHEDSDDFGKAWRQTIRWLVSDVPERIDVQLHRQSQASKSAVQLQVRVRDRDFQPLENASVRVTITGPKTDAESDRKSPALDKANAEANSDPTSGEPTKVLKQAKSRAFGKPPTTIAINAESSLKESGLYEADYTARTSGAYRAHVTIHDADGKPVGESEIGWTSEPAAAEFRQITPNRKLMQQIAKATGGEVVALDDLNTFVNTLSVRKMPITEQWTRPLWDQTWVFLLAVGCLVGEWGLRRWKGLP